MAIDPGQHESGCVVLVDGIVEYSGLEQNEVLCHTIDDFLRTYPTGDVVIEHIRCYGMPVGAEIFDTVEWCGEFRRICKDSICTARFISRKQVVVELCGSQKAKDSNVRQAVIDAFPATGGGKVPQIGTKSAPGPLYGISGHLWQALGLALAFIRLAELEAVSEG